MTPTVPQLIAVIYEGDFRNRGFCHSDNYIEESVKFLDIPISEQIFEVPSFAFDSFVNATKSDTEYTKLVAKLECKGLTTYYKTLDRNMKDILRSICRCSNLIKIVTASNKIYYGTGGIIFDDEFIPVMACSWQMKKIDDPCYKYEIIKPVLHVYHKTFLSKGDEMERYIVNKIIPACLTRAVYVPYLYRNSEKIKYLTGSSYRISVVIDKVPFLTTEPAIPHPSITDAELMQVVIDNMEEVVQ